MTLFKPEQVSSFSFAGRSFDPSTGRVSLRYSLDSFEFEEVLIFPLCKSSERITQNSTELEAALRLLHLICGISYYKAAVPMQILDPTASIDEELKIFLTKLYLKGLGEFSYKNQIDLRDRINFPVTSPSLSATIQKKSDNEKLLVPLGGGKDSLLSIALCKNSGFAFDSCVLGESQIFDELEHHLPCQNIRVQRFISPALIEINKHGALNGHIPISAIFAATFTFLALLHGHTAIVMSQEHSANIGNLFWKEQEINHQYSKSLEFEADFANILKKKVSGNLEYFSLLRSCSELKICKLFAQHSEFHPYFSSCNRNFTHQGSSAAQKWCGTCPKCTFVFLAMAAFLPKEAVLNIFKSNVFEYPENISLFRELLGISGFKPFECVGETAEAILALKLMAEQTAWQKSETLKTLLSELPELNIEELKQRCFSPQPDRIPEKFKHILTNV